MGPAMLPQPDQPGRLRRRRRRSDLLATDLADYLVLKGSPSGRRTMSSARCGLANVRKPLNQ